MSSSADQPQDRGTYFIDAENAAEMARLTKQARLMTTAMGQLLPDHASLAHPSTILDVASGPGSWVLDVAQTYSGAQVVGIDISVLMMSYARYQASELNMHNATFEV